MTGRTFRTGVPELVPDVRDDVGYLEAIPGVAAEYCTPIRAGGRVVGALNVESRGGLRPEVCREVDRFAELLGRHLERLPAEQVVAMRRLGRTVGALFERRDPESTMAAVVAEACELAGTDSGALVVGTGARARIALAAGPLAEALGSIDPADLARLAELLEPLTSCYSSGEATGLAFTGGESLRQAGASAVVARCPSVPVIAARGCCCSPTPVRSPSVPTSSSRSSCSPRWPAAAWRTRSTSAPSSAGRGSTR